ncbi:hypothetical protein [Parafilimonas sp.]|uniref:hypothetical protein n=1 Tax=Parafilimonas sp. TaxID=1969739 RepID=UPI0039E23453
MNEILKSVILEIAQVKHTINQLNKMTEFTGRSYEKEINFLLDRLSTLQKIKDAIEKQKGKSN